MKENIEPLDKLLEEISIKERKSRRRFYYSLILPIAIATILLIVFTYKINEARKTIDSLNQEIEKHNHEIENKNVQISDIELQIETLNKAYTDIESKFSQNFDWSENDVLIKDSSKIRDSKLAVDKIQSLFKASREEINLEIVVRYNVKRVDNGKVENILKKCGLRNVYFFATEFYNPTPTNTISFGKKVSVSEIKLIALVLIWAGLDIKKIDRYPSSLGNRRIHSIEISGDNSLIDSESITIEQIMKATSF
jgi:cell division protein FtsL